MRTLEIPAKMISKRHSIILGIDDSKAINQRKLKELMFESVGLNVNDSADRHHILQVTLPQDIITVVETYVRKQKKKELMEQHIQGQFKYQLK